MLCVFVHVLLSLKGDKDDGNGDGKGDDHLWPAQSLTEAEIIAQLEKTTDNIPFRLLWMLEARNESVAPTKSQGE